MITIDGSAGEAGGQILRTACSLSMATKQSCRIFSIRKGRPKPGLATQHLLGVQALSHLCGGTLEGDSLKSEEVKFYPGSNYKEQISINIPTAASITLLLQTLIPAALFAPEPIRITFNGGGTDTFFSPSFDYFQFVFLKILKKIFSEKIADINLIKRGYYPEGGAKLEIKIYPLLRQSYGGQASKVKSLNLTKRGEFEKIQIFSGASEFLRNKKVAERQIIGVREIMGKLKLPLEEKINYYDTACPGSQICLVAQFENTVLGIDNLGKLGKRAEDVGKEAALGLLGQERLRSCLDKYMADQILTYMALVPGKSQVSVSEITNHCKTNAWVIEKFLDGKFEIEENIISWNQKT